MSISRVCNCKKYDYDKCHHHKNHYDCDTCNHHKHNYDRFNHHSHDCNHCNNCHHRKNHCDTCNHHKHDYDRFNHHGHDCNHCNNCHHHKNHCDCCDNRKCCDNRFRVRLGGLTSGLAFRLNQLIGCNIKLVMEGKTKPVEGKLIMVGTDFAELLLKNNVSKKDKYDQFLTVPFESIKLIESSIIKE